MKNNSLNHKKRQKFMGVSKVIKIEKFLLISIKIISKIRRKIKRNIYDFYVYRKKSINSNNYVANFDLKI